MATRLEAKRPAEVIDYVADWSEFLGEDTIATSTAVGDGVTVAETNDNDSVTLTISGGTSGTLGKVTNTITTAGGKTEVEKFFIFVSDFEEPVSVAELKEHLRIWDDHSRDAEISGLGVAAREFCEAYTGHVLLRRQFTQDRPTFASLRITQRPLVTIDALVYDDVDGVEQDFEDFRAAPRRGVYPAPVLPNIGVSFPAVWSEGGVSAIYTAGYGEGEVPGPFISAIKILVAFWFEYPDGMVDGKPVEIPTAVVSLLRRFQQPAMI